MFSRNFGGIAWAATTVSRLTGAAAAGRQLDHGPDRVLGFRGHAHAPNLYQPGGRRTAESVCYPAARSVFLSNPIKKDEKDDTMTRFLSKPRRGGAANAQSADARPRGGVRIAAAGAAAVLALGVAACGGSDDERLGR